MNTFISEVDRGCRNGWSLVNWLELGPLARDDGPRTSIILLNDVLLSKNNRKNIPRNSPSTTSENPLLF